MTISRRDALLGAGAAAMVAGVPGAVQADPVVALVNKALAYRDQINNGPADMLDDRLDALCEPLDEMLDLIRLTPATSAQGIAGKVRVAWIQTAPMIDHERTGPPDEFDQIGRLASSRFIWSALQDLERLAVDFERQIGGMRP